MKIRFRTAACALCLGAAANALWALGDEKETWTEADVTLPTGLRTERLTPFVLDQRSTMRLAIDADSLNVGPDGVVRYVFVARSGSGAVNALYEGVRCKTAEVRVYAHWDPSSQQWRARKDEGWQRLEAGGATQRALQMAQAGICDGKAPSRSPRTILDSLQNGRADQMR
jgi:hypothetical protein